MLNSSYGDQIIDSSFNYELQLDNGVNQYSVMTNKDDGGNVYIAIVNLNLEGENTIKIRVDDLDLTGKTMEIQQLSGDTFYAENSLDNPDNVDVERSTATIESERASVTLAPHSFTVIKIADALSQETPEEPEPTVDTEKLEAAINEYSDLQESDYTADSWAKFQTALEAAKAALNVQTQEEVDAALADLQEAKGNLIEAEKSETGEDPGAQEPSGDPSGQTPDQGGKDSDSGTPQTGDRPPIAGWTALIISCGIIILCMKRKRAN